MLTSNSNTQRSFSGNSNENRTSSRSDHFGITSRRELSPNLRSAESYNEMLSGAFGGVDHTSFYAYSEETAGGQFYELAKKVNPDLEMPSDMYKDFLALAKDHVKNGFTIRIGERKNGSLCNYIGTKDENGGFSQRFEVFFSEADKNALLPEQEVSAELAEKCILGYAVRGNRFSRDIVTGSAGALRGLPVVWVNIAPIMDILDRSSVNPAASGNQIKEYLDGISNPSAIARSLAEAQEPAVPASKSRRGKSAIEIAAEMH